MQIGQAGAGFLMPVPQTLRPPPHPNTVISCRGWYARRADQRFLPPRRCGRSQHHRKGRGAETTSLLRTAPRSWPASRHRRPARPPPQGLPVRPCTLNAPGIGTVKIRHPPAGQPHGEVGSQRVRLAPRRKPRQGQPIRQQRCHTVPPTAAVAFQNSGRFPVVGVHRLLCSSGTARFQTRYSA